MKETTVWSGSPSQFLNMWFYIGFIAFIVMACFIPLLFVLTPIYLVLLLWNYLVVRNTRYEVSTERLKIFAGVLNRNINDLELYRVKDTRLYEPWYYRMVGLGKIIVLTSDLSNPIIVIKAIPKANETRELIRDCVEKRRVVRGISAIDVV